MLCHVGAMHIVVVLHGASVLVVDLCEELEELVKIDNLKDVVLFQKTCGNKRHRHIASYFPGELKYVEMERIHLVVKVIVFFDKQLDIFALEVEVYPVRVDLDVSEVVIPLECFPFCFGGGCFFILHLSFL